MYLFFENFCLRMTKINQTKKILNSIITPRNIIMYSKWVSMGIFGVIVGCSVTLLSIPTNGTSQTSEKFPFQSKPFPSYISKLFPDESSQTDDGNYIKFETAKGEENNCQPNWVVDGSGGQVVKVSCEKKFSVTNPTFLKITGFDDIQLPLESPEQLKNKRFILYTSFIETQEIPLGISFPISAFTRSNFLCIYIGSQNQTEVCAEKDITLKDIIMSKEKPVEMKFTATENESCSSFSSKTTSARGDYKLIVVSLSKGFENQFKTTIQESLKKTLFDLKEDNRTNKRFTLLVIGSGRGITEVLTSEKLPELPKEGSKPSILSQVRSFVQFNAQDLRPMDDLELVDDLIENYELQDKQVGGILYITNDDRFERGIPRNQCMPLAWHRDNIQLEVLTSQSCNIWREDARLNDKQCRELNQIIQSKEKQKNIDALVNVFKQFLAK